jgi:hypothetical protein
VPAVGKGGSKLVPACPPIMHFVRWAPRLGLAFIPEGVWCCLRDPEAIRALEAAGRPVPG